MAGRHVYEPDAKGEFLVTSDGARIECTPHLYFLVRKNVTSPYVITPETRDRGYTFFRGVRLNADTVVKGVGYKRGEGPFNSYVSASQTYLPNGTLLLRAFQTASDGSRFVSGLVRKFKAAVLGESDWFAVFPEQQRRRHSVGENFRRAEYPEGSGQLTVPFPEIVTQQPGLVLAADLGDVEYIAGKWASKEQAAAHIRDAAAHDQVAGMSWRMRHRGVDRRVTRRAALPNPQPNQPN